jgi:iron complex transport system substrate-binding protein
LTNRTVYPERIVSLSPSNTELLFAVGAGDKVVGVTDYCNYPAELEAKIAAKRITQVGGYWDPSVEAIFDLNPDLVFVSTVQCTLKTNNCKTNCSRRCELTTKVANRLKNLGLYVLTLSPHSIDNVLGDILTVGNATGNSEKANALVETLKKRVAIVVENSKALSHKPTVYFEIWNSPYISVNSKTWIGNIINLAGGTNVFGDAVTEWPIIEPEEIIKRNPDIMVFPVIPNVTRFWGSFEAVKKRQGWDKITAVKEGRLYEIPRDFVSRPGPRLVDALELLETIVNLSS